MLLTSARGLGGEFHWTVEPTTTEFAPRAETVATSFCGIRAPKTTGSKDWLPEAAISTSATGYDVFSAVNSHVVGSLGGCGTEGF